MTVNVDTDTVAVDIRQLTKRFGPVTALGDVSLSIADNEFFTLLGPSGCGKTTLLRTIAGFEAATTGEIHLYGEDIASLPPNKRPVNTVFQHYALFPHLSVLQNVMFGLQRLGKPASQARQRAQEMLDLVQLKDFADRLPTQLSGGQQQRVALARALAPNPKVLLLDEPLSALDLKLRQAVRLELQQIQQDTGITFIFVTHDQEEALTMSDRIAVLSEGTVQQVGTPKAIYEQPENRFVANFIGETNLLNVQTTTLENGDAMCVLQSGRSIKCTAAHGAKVGDGHISIRPEQLSLSHTDDALLVGKVTRHVYLGTDMQISVELEHGEHLTVRQQNTETHAMPSLNDTVGLQFSTNAARLLAD